MAKERLPRGSENSEGEKQNKGNKKAEKQPSRGTPHSSEVKSRRKRREPMFHLGVDNAPNDVHLREVKINYDGAVPLDDQD